MKKETNILITLLFLCVSVITHSQNNSNNNFEITYKRESNHNINFYYSKKLPGSYSVKLTFSNLTNYNGSSEFETIVKLYSGKLMTLRPADAEKSISFSYQASFIRGVPNPKIDADIIYTLPFKSGTEIKIIESGSLNEKYFNNKKPKNWKSYIINRINSDTVRSMRRGIVVDLKNMYVKNTSLEYEYTSKMNSVTIEHPDGSYASYKGFKKNSFFVKLGQEVYPNSKLGALELFNQNYFRLYFRVYYLIKGENGFNTNNTLENSKSNFEHITPTFAFGSGNGQLSNRNNYIVEFNDDLFFQELSKREKKKFKKNPTEFK